MPRGNWIFKITLGSILLVIFLFLVRGVIAGAFAGVQFLSNQEVTATAPLEGILLKEEKVISAPVTGQLQSVREDGCRLEVGARAAQIAAADQDSGTISVYTPTAGIICLHLDGLENILSPGNLDLLNLSKLEKPSVNPVAVNKPVDKGQPLFKIVDNLEPMLLYAEIPKSKLPPGLADKQGSLAATWENQPLSIKVSELKDKGDRWAGIFQVTNYPDSLLHRRKVQITITTDKIKGLLVPTGAVVYRDGVPGIYLVVKKKAQWVAVKTERELKGRVAVSGRGLGEETRYVSHPFLIREGSRVE